MHSCFFKDPVKTIELETMDFLQLEFGHWGKKNKKQKTNNLWEVKHNLSQTGRLWEKLSN